MAHVQERDFYNSIQVPPPDSPYWLSEDGTQTRAEAAASAMRSASIREASPTRSASSEPLDNTKAQPTPASQPQAGNTNAPDGLKSANHPILGLSRQHMQELLDQLPEASIRELVQDMFGPPEAPSKQPVEKPPALPEAPTEQRVKRHRKRPPRLSKQYIENFVYPRPPRSRPHRPKNVTWEAQNSVEQGVPDKPGKTKTESK